MVTGVMVGGLYDGRIVENIAPRLREIRLPLPPPMLRASDANVDAIPTVTQPILVYAPRTWDLPRSCFLCAAYRHFHRHAYYLVREE